jgi:predicted exporter
MGAGLWTVWRVNQGAPGAWIDPSLSALIPAEDADPAAERAWAAFTQRLERQVVLVVAHADRAAAELAAGRLTAALAQSPALAQVRGRITPEEQRAWAGFYAPYRRQLLSRDARQMLASGQGDAWRKQALALIYSPFGGVGAEELAADPFLLLRHFLLERAALAGGGQVSAGWQERQDANGTWHILVTGELAVDPYGIGASQEWIAQLEALETQLRAEFPGVSLLRQGAIFYSAAASRQAQFEVSAIGTGSAIGVVLLNLLVFRRLIPLGVTVLSVAGGLVAALAVTLWMTGPLHLFTLVFGSTLIGVTEDYSSHFLCHQLDRRGAHGGASTLRRILPSLAMSLATTLLAYMALLLAPFHVLRQLTVFSVVGLAVSFLIVVLWFPALTRALPRRVLPGGAAAAGWLAAWRRLGRGKRWLPVALLAAGALPLAVGLRANDDVRQLQSLDPALVRQEHTIAALFGTGGSAEMLLVRGPTPEALLRRMEAAAGRLERAVAQGDLRQYLAVSAFVPSARQQREDFALVQERLVRPWAGRQAAALGLGADTAPRLERAPFRPLTAEAWLASPVSAGWRSLWQDAGADGLFAAVPLRGVKDPDALRRLSEGLQGVAFVNKADEVSSHFHTYRVRILWMLALAVVLTYGLLVLRYGWRAALRIQVPSLAAGLCALAMLRVTGLPFNLFSVLALLLVLGMGIDYTLFFAESHRAAETTLLSVSLAGVTTILSFGLLAFSSTAAIANFGVVVFTGVLVSFLLAPLALHADG